MSGLILKPNFNEPIIRVAMEDKAIAMPMEEYLTHVVPAEIGPYYPYDAMLAMAIAARSYAYYTLEKPRHIERGANVCATTHCQAFAGSQLESRRINAAIKATSGQILTYGGEIVDALYSACCGGHTFDNEDVFIGGEPLPYLRGVRCFCDGKKRGHGVGLCQEGAKKMAEAGRSYVQILFHYYGGLDGKGHI